ncbi:MAG: ferrochelatase [Betaproteobacteria bacterium]|nr:ferrochelatase [Betaproteobacteria bacterium]
MHRYWPEPGFAHDTPERTGVLLVNLGTPEAPTSRALRAYLREFLADPRVVELPRALWLPLLHGVILNVRPPRSARKYAAVWTDAGSPLRVYTERQATLVGQRLGDRVEVAWAMRYGQPSMAATLEALRARNCTRILVLPLYPQYCASTTASTFDELARCVRHWRNVPELRLVRSFHDHPRYIDSLAAAVQEHWSRHGHPERLVMSFHGMPRSSLTRGDPYHCHCHKTARLLAQHLQLADHQWQLTFQSRFGRTEWLQPYTQPAVQALARSGVRKVDVICPGFVADCLETLEEIAMECRQAFLDAGGSEFGYIPCLNDRDGWIDTLVDIARQHLCGWIDPPGQVPADLTRRVGRARGLGAPA